MSIEQKFLSALQSGNVEEAKSAIENGADVNMVGEGGNTPLHFAAIKSNPEMFAMLLKAGGNLSAENNAGNEPYDCTENNEISEMVLDIWEKEFKQNNK